MMNQTNEDKMRKKIVVVLIAIVTFTMAGYNVYQAQNMDKLVDLTLSNIEALANDDESDCQNVNGYKQWNINHGFLEREKQFYDCCTNLRTGYSPSGTCHN